MEEEGMRACMLAYTFYEYDFRVMRYAEALVDRGDHVDVIALRRAGAKPFEIIRGVHVYRIQDRVVNEKGKLSYLFRILRFLMKSSWMMGRMHVKRPYDLVHVHSVPDFLVFAAVLPKRLGAKIILDIHDILPEFFASKFSGGQKGPFFKILVWVEKISTKFANHVIIANHIWAQKLIERSVKPSQLSALINYPNTALFYPKKRRQGHNGFKMLYHGTVNWHQGLDIAVKAFALIKDVAPNVSLHIYGGGTHWDMVGKLVRQLHVSDRVFLNPTIPFQAIAEVVSEADLGIIPKRNDQFGGEAFSTKTLEFMSCQVPVVISKTKIDQHYFHDNVVKFFEPENPDDLAAAMLEMIRDQTLRERLAANALEFAKRNSWEKKKEGYLALVDGLTGKTQDRNTLVNPEPGKTVEQ
jgi:glycosyltransferase involved in cell wall biosynthesis